MSNYFIQLKNRTKKRLRRSLSKHDLQAYKIIISHMINDNSIASCDPKLNEFLICNKKTHYDLVITPNKILLVNSKDVVDLEVCEEVRKRTIEKCIEHVSRIRQQEKSKILDRKSNILDKILVNVKK